MPKSWEELTQSEKIEELRRDVSRLFDAINSTNRSINVLANEISEMRRKESRGVK